MSDDGNIWAKPTEKRLKNKTNDFNFDFAEKSTRKAIIFGAIFGFISAICAYNEAYGWLNDEIEIIGSIIYGVAVFIPCFFCGLIAFRSGNYWGFAVPPLALIISFYMPYQFYDGSFKKVVGMIACYYGGIIIVLMLSFFIGIIMQWVQSGKE